MSLFAACRIDRSSEPKCDPDCIWTGARKRKAPRETTGEAAPKKRRRSFLLSSTAERIEELEAARDEANANHTKGCTWVLSSWKTGWAKQVRTFGKT